MCYSVYEKEDDTVFRKFVGLLLVLMMAATGVYAAELDGVPAYPAFEWELDALNHWKVEVDGTSAAPEMHSIDPETMICSGCGAEVWLYDDGAAELSSYNEQGDLVWYASFDSEGVKTGEGAFIYEYDEAGCKTREYQYENGVFITQTVFAMGEEGELYPVWSESYYDDGTWARNEYDGHGNCIKAYTYDENDVLTSEITTEYALNADGWYYEAKTTTILEGTIFISEYNEYGDWVSNYIEEPDGTVVSDVTFAYEYEDGVKVRSWSYESGVLAWETHYNAEGMIIQEIEYLEDGSTVVYNYDEEGNLIEQ